MSYDLAISVIGGIITVKVMEDVAVMRLFKRGNNTSVEPASEDLEYLQKLKSLVMQLRSSYERLAKTKIEKGVLSICKTSQKILQGLIDDNSKISGHRFFIDYYLPELVQILNQYIAIKSNNISSAQAMETIKQIDDFIPVADKAFKKVLENKATQRSSDIDVDIKIMMDNLRSKRLI